MSWQTPSTHPPLEKVFPLTYGSVLFCDSMSTTIFQKQTNMRVVHMPSSVLKTLLALKITLEWAYYTPLKFSGGLEGSNLVTVFVSFAFPLN